MIGAEESVEAGLLGGPGQRQDLVVASTVVRFEQDTQPHRGVSPIFSSERAGLSAAGTSGKWHATECPAVCPVGSSRMTGSSSAQRCPARGQRVRNRQPLGGWACARGPPRV